MSYFTRKSTARARKAALLPIVATVAVAALACLKMGLSGTGLAICVYPCIVLLSIPAKATVHIHGIGRRLRGS